jgi:uncharacterized protein (TIGR02145 family)
MNKYSIFYRLLFVAALFVTLLFWSCGKEDPKPKFPPKDKDGNVYRTVVVNGKEWFAENLKTTKLNDGTPIANLQENEDWEDSELPAYAIYEDIEGYKEDFGLLYNGYAVQTGKLCPNGWRVSTLEDWEDLVESIGEAPGSKLKTIGTDYWKGNEDGEDLIGFGAKGGGYRFPFGDFHSFQFYGCWWTHTIFEDNKMAIPYVTYNNGTLDVGDNVWIDKPEYGVSVRCVRDVEILPADSGK